MEPSAAPGGAAQRLPSSGHPARGVPEELGPTEVSREEHKGKSSPTWSQACPEREPGNTQLASSLEGRREPAPGTPHAPPWGVSLSSSSSLVSLLFSSCGPFHFVFTFYFSFFQFLSLFDLTIFLPPLLYNSVP